MKTVMAIILACIFTVNVYADDQSNSVADRNVEWVQNRVMDRATSTWKTGVYDSSGTQIDIFSVSGTISTDAGTTVTIGGFKAESTVPDEVSDGDAVAVWADTFGRQVQKDTDLATQSSQVSVIDQGTRSSGQVQIFSATLDADPTFEAATSVFVGDKDKVTWALKTTSTQAGRHPIVTYTFEGSPDNSTWLSCDVVMAGGGTDAPVSSITHTSALSTDVQNSFAYLPSTVQYMRVTADSVSTDAVNTSVLTGYIMWQK